MKGYEQVRSKLQKLPEALAQAGKDGLHEVGQKIFDQAKATVPIDTGTLKGSGRMDESGSNTKIKITIGFYTDYAAYVHEIMYYKHPHGKAKYLEDPFNSVISNIESIIASKMKGVL
ncbi:MAG: HK97 gp10 family phage protein [Candidatus Pacebacteria bacterium]|nr:HK97 gp10 family phage protein [Fermentimonas sp.]MDD4804328.1 HK97 gp10 family phage protein [Candidatus Paceibacterota bacterium]